MRIMETLDILLEKKTKAVNLIVKIVKKQNEALKNFKLEKVVFLNLRKEKILGLMKSIDIEMERFLLTKKKYPKNTKDLIKNINSIFNELINIEKENEILLNNIIALKKGDYINNYKKYAK